MPRPSRAGTNKKRRGRGRPSRETSPALTRQRVLQTAVKLVDQKGVDSLSIRKLAAELGVAPNSLYWYVRDKDDLLQGVVDLLFGSLTVPPSDTGPWTERLREVCRWYRKRLLEHPNVVETASFARTFPSVFGPLTAAIGAVLLSAGFEGSQLVRLNMAAYFHTMGFVTLEVARARFGFVPLEVARERLARLSPGKDLFFVSPTKGSIRIDSAAVATYWSLVRDQDMNGLFEYSLDCLLAGFAAETPVSVATARVRQARQTIRC